MWRKRSPHTYTVAPYLIHQYQHKKRKEDNLLLLRTYVYIQSFNCYARASGSYNSFFSFQTVRFPENRTAPLSRL